MLTWSGMRSTLERPANWRYSAVSNKASSMARSLRPTHCWRITSSKGGRPVLARGAFGAISDRNSVYGTTRSISSRNAALRVRRMLRFRPSSCWVMTPLFLPCLAHAIRA